MVELSPIPRKIQQRLLEKMRALARVTRYSDESTTQLSPNDMSSRSTFIKMVSGLENPVVLMGGELVNNQIQSGFDQIYGSRKDLYDTIVNQNNVDISEVDVSNSNKRPMPGIKSIDVSFKGGTRAQREATISWTCWSFDDLNRLMPHFLAHGKTVLIEFGWVYRNQPLGDLPSFIDENGIRREAFGDYSEEVINANGDMDLIVGQIKNFEFTTRADGAFDCQTIVGSIGVNLLSDIKPNSDQHNVEGELFQLDLPAATVKEPYLGGNTYESEATSYNDIQRKELQQKFDVISEASNNQLDNKILTLNTDVTFKYLIRNLDIFISDKLNPPAGQIGDMKFKKIPDTRGDEIRWMPNKFIAFEALSKKTSRQRYKNMGMKTTKFERTPMWVRWGWFEDNILSKFTAMTSDSSNRPVMELRSIERSFEGEVDYESVKVKNDSFLETTDVNRYILPSQFSPQLEDKFNVTYIDQKQNAREATVRLTGDDIRIVELSSIINDSNNFPEFKASTDKKEGYLRNMLINVELIQEAFGCNYLSEFNIEVLTVEEGLNNLFDKLNETLPFWSFELREDEVETNRVKIVDSQISGVDFDKPIDTQKTTYQGGEILFNGIFEFPVWKETSMVKSQNITAKVPNAMALAVMYGSNLNVVKDGSTTGKQFTESEGVITGALAKEFKDLSKSGLDFAIRNKESQNIGTTSGDANEPLTVDGSNDSVFQFLVDNRKNIISSYDERVKNINLVLEKNDKELKNKKKQQAKRDRLDTNAPAPLLDFTEDNDLKEAIFGEAIGAGILTEKAVESIYNQKFIRGNMKPSFIKSIKHILNVNPQTQTGDDDQGVIIPLDMELEIDGIGGIYPGNSFHSSYLPQNYKDKTVFQMFDVNHKVDSSGWTTTLGGKMRSSLSQVKGTLYNRDKIIEGVFKKYKERVAKLRPEQSKDPFLEKLRESKKKKKT